MSGAEPMNALALVPVRGELPGGALETVAEAGGRALLVGRDTADAAKDLAGVATELRVWEAGDYAPASWAASLASLLAGETLVVCPNSPDGRDLAPRIAQVLERPLISGAGTVTAAEAVVIRHGGRSEVPVAIAGPVIVTFVAGARRVVVDPDLPLPEFTVLELERVAGADAELVAELPADPTTMDLAEARRIVGGGAGVRTAENLALLGAIGARLGASLGATRVVTDAGWTGHERQIGTTGVEVDPALYLAFGISGAVQHVMGLGDPDHVIAVNTDASCPMMAMADLAVVTDAPAVVDELARALGVSR